MTDEQKDDASKPARRRRGPKKATARYLENSATYYLGRFATSSAHLKTLMMQKVTRSHQQHGTDMVEGEKFVDDIIAKFLRLGFLDDKAYAEMRARALHGKGTPLRGIRFKLKQKGLGDDDIEAALNHLQDEAETENLDLAAAVRLAERRRLGPYRSDDPEIRDQRREKDMAVLARAGFSYDVVKDVIDAEDIATLEYSIHPS